MGGVESDLPFFRPGTEAVNNLLGARIVFETMVNIVVNFFVVSAIFLSFELLPYRMTALPLLKRASILRINACWIKREVIE